jgi:spore maturation protein SpmA
MLNYVWITLLFLGIGTALIYDIIDSSADTYKNNRPLNVEIILEEIPAGSKQPVNSDIIIHGDSLARFYNLNKSSDLKIPAVIYYDPEGISTFKFNIPDKAPALWNDMGKAYGKENDLTGKLVVYNREDSLLSAGLLFEQVSFLKLKNITNELLNYAGTAVQISIGLIGIMALWLGIMKIAETAGLIAVIARMLRPVTRRLFPDVPSEHPAMGSMVMNISANMLGLGNAATPFGLKAMEELDKLNPDKGTATNAMITFLAINTAGLTLIPASAIAVRAAAGSTDPALIIGTAFFGSLCATTAGIIAAKTFEKLQKKDSLTSFIKNNIKKILFFLLIAAGIILLITTGIWNRSFFTDVIVNADTLRGIIETISILAIPVLIIFFTGYGALKKVKVYEQFIEGAKEGFNIAVRIIPYLVAMLVAIGIFRAGGAMDWLIYLVSPITTFIGMPAEALPMAFMRPLSGSGSLGSNGGNINCAWT